MLEHGREADLHFGLSCQEYTPLFRSWEGARAVGVNPNVRGHRHSLHSQHPPGCISNQALHHRMIQCLRSMTG